MRANSFCKQQSRDLRREQKQFLQTAVKRFDNRTFVSTKPNQENRAYLCKRRVLTHVSTQYNMLILESLLSELSLERTTFENNNTSEAITYIYYAHMPHIDTFPHTQKQLYLFFQKYLCLTILYCNNHTIIFQKFRYLEKTTFENDNCNLNFSKFFQKALKN